MANNDFFDYDDNLKNSQFAYLQKLSAPSNLLYNLMLLVVFGVFAALPFIHVDLTSSAPTSIQSNYLKETVYVPHAGQISLLRIENNQPVRKGDTIVAIDDVFLLNEITITKNKKETIEQSLHDIHVLQNYKFSGPAPVLFTSQYQTQFSHLLEEKASLSAKYENTTKAYNRNLMLFEQKVIASSEFEQYDLAYRQAQADMKLLETQSRSRWQTEQYQFNQELNNLKIRQNELTEAIKNSVVTANVSGIGYKEEGIQLGAFVQSGQRIAEIVPDSFLIAVCYVSPKDIGFIKEGQRVQLQIDAYNYFEWGMLNGTVFEVAKDVNIVQNKPFYAVKCKVDKSFLTLKNGYRGIIMKGMTGRANFYLTTRSLWHLLFSSINDWLNPKAN